MVLVYLGFLKAYDMSKPGELPFPHAASWESSVKAHSASLFPEEVWGQKWSLSGVPLIPLIRSLDVSLNEVTFA